MRRQKSRHMSAMEGAPLCCIGLMAACVEEEEDSRSRDEGGGLKIRGRKAIQGNRKRKKHNFTELSQWM